MNTVFFQQASIFILGMAAYLSDSLKTAVLASKQSGERLFSFVEKEIFVKKKIAGASNIHELLDSSTERKPGVCSFEKGGYTAANEALVANKLCLLYGTGDAADDPGKIKYSTAVPAELGAAELIISQEGTEIFRSTVQRLSSRTTENKAGDQYHELNAFVLLRDDRKVSANLHFPEGVAMPAAAAGTTAFVHLSFGGLVTRKN